jgi:hypothetical protein
MIKKQQVLAGGAAIVLSIATAQAVKWTPELGPGIAEVKV